MFTAPRFIPHYRVADYQQWQGDWELWDGVTVTRRTSPFGRHQAIAATPFRLLANQLEASKCFATPLYEMIAVDVLDIAREYTTVEVTDMIKLQVCEDC